ncbi:hypothetical protein JOM56_015059 [Amanita muscaria]
MDPEMIFVLDSEEDEEEEVIRGTSNGRQARSRLISPPPPHAHRPSPVCHQFHPDNIRSRLRSSRTSSTLSITASPISPASTLRKRTRKPKIEGEYRYLCPVVGCGSIHVSVKIDGEWRSERDEDKKKPGGRRSIKFPNDLVADEEGGVDVRGRGTIPVFV